MIQLIWEDGSVDTINDEDLNVDMLVADERLLMEIKHVDDI